MSRLCISLIFLLFSAQSICAQTISGYGIKGGVNYSRIAETGTLQGDTEFLAQFSFGLYGELHMYDFLFLRYELLYSQRGTSRTNYSPYRDNIILDSGWMFETTRKLAYVEPVFLAHIPIHSSDRMRMHLFTGVSLAINIKATTEIKGRYFGLLFEESRNDRSSVLPLDPGLVLGTGFDFQIASTYVTIETRYNHGLMNIWDRGAEYLPYMFYENNEAVVYDDGVPRMHNRTISVMIGLGL